MRGRQPARMVLAMSRLYGALSAEQVVARASALERFATWQREHPADLSAEEALAGVASLYELLPVRNRARSVDPSGVIAMHRALSVLRRSRE